MDIKFSINFLQNEIDQLSQILKCDMEDIPNRLSSLSQASMEEYARMILGQKVFTRGTDFQQYRLFLLIKYVFKNQIPDEQLICDLFQTTVNQSRSLLRAVMSKYQYDLEVAINNSMRNILESAAPSDDNDFYTVVVDNDNLIDTLNRLQLSIRGDLPPIKKVPNTVSKYKLDPSSYKELNKHFNIRITSEQQS